jgi:hypothetical protein
MQMMGVVVSRDQAPVVEFRGEASVLQLPCRPGILFPTMNSLQRPRL